MIAKVYSAIPYGYDGHIVTVEGNIAKSLPAFNIVGMANKTITEARERVRSAITSSDLSFPDKKVTINLAPAELVKDGSHLDLPIALAVLVLSKQLLPTDVENRLFVGEVSLDGLVKPVRGIINIVEAAKSAGFTEIYLPSANLTQASLIPDVHLYGIDSLSKLLLHLKGIQLISEYSPSQPVYVKNTLTDSPTLDNVYGQDLAKRALTIAIAGHHNILLSGPPGAGKTLLARVAANLLPPPTSLEQTAITKIHTLYGVPDQHIASRPFRSPHHTASAISIIGGGAHALPGEISLAHHGILFLDEIPEFPRNVLEALRQPLEDRQITITRANQRVTYPANFILIATMNPCPCGHLNDPTKECTCTTHQIEQYRKRLSGPILDRIDLIINVEKVSHTDLIESISHVKKRQQMTRKYIISAIQLQKMSKILKQAYRPFINMQRLTLSLLNIYKTSATINQPSTIPIFPLKTSLIMSKLHQQRSSFSNLPLLSLIYPHASILRRSKSLRPLPISPTLPKSCLSTFLKPSASVNRSFEHKNYRLHTNFKHKNRPVLSFLEHKPLAFPSKLWYNEPNVQS